MFVIYYKLITQVQKWTNITEKAVTSQWSLRIEDSDDILKIQVYEVFLLLKAL